MLSKQPREEISCASVTWTFGETNFADVICAPAFPCVMAERREEGKGPACRFLSKSPSSEKEATRVHGGAHA